MIMEKIGEMIGSSDRIDFESEPTKDEINTRSMGQLTAAEAEKYGNIRSYNTVSAKNVAIPVELDRS